mgnify:CR=1 FL=1
MDVGKYTLENEIKAADAVKEAGTKDNLKLLVAYDKRGGLIRLEGIPVPLGTFWDFNKGEVRKPDAKLKVFWKGLAKATPASKKRR